MRLVLLYGSETLTESSNVTPLEVYDAIFKIRSNSVGLDEILLRLLKNLIIQFYTTFLIFLTLQLLLEFFNRMEPLKGGTNRENT
jgi:hypothetical protein